MRQWGIRHIPWDTRTLYRSLGIYWDILGIYWGYTGDILGIYWGYTGDILGVGLMPSLRSRLFLLLCIIAYILAIELLREASHVL